MQGEMGGRGRVRDGSVGRERAIRGERGVVSGARVTADFLSELHQRKIYVREHGTCRTGWGGWGAARGRREGGRIDVDT